MENGHQRMGHNHEPTNDILQRPNRGLYIEKQATGEKKFQQKTLHSRVLQSEGRTNEYRAFHRPGV